MTESNENPEAQEKSGDETGAEQKVEAEQPKDVQPAEVSKEVNKDARTWAMVCHLLGLAGLPLPIVGNIVGPLIIWQIKKDDFPFVDEQGKEAVNFQISMSIYGLVAAVLIFACIGVFLLPAVYVVDLVFLLIAAVKSNNGHHYRYPLTIRFIK